MSNPELAPVETLCRPGAADAGPELLSPRAVPLGGPRAMDVRRTLPQHRRSLIGAWCFLDHYGPDEVAATGGMHVARHPHTGLQTVSWLFTGKIEHRDSSGAHALVRPGDFNIMTAGRGISHSEFSTPDTDVLHGAQLWVALPDATRHDPPGFEHYRPEPVAGPGWVLRVFLGELAGSRSPVRTHTPLVGAEILLEPGAELALGLDTAFEHGVLLDAGDLTLDGHVVPQDHLAYLPTGRDGAVLAAGDRGARALLIGGTPLGEQIVMWWNFVGRSHDEIVAYRAQWMAEIGAEPADRLPHDGVPHGAAAHHADAAPQGRFGPFPPGQPPALPAPTLPNTRMMPRG